VFAGLIERGINDKAPAANVDHGSRAAEHAHSEPLSFFVHTDHKEANAV
jgi:hypothetical protein